MVFSLPGWALGLEAPVLFCFGSSLGRRAPVGICLGSALGHRAPVELCCRYSQCCFFAWAPTWGAAPQWEFALVPHWDALLQWDFVVETHCDLVSGSSLGRRAPVGIALVLHRG
jgi:hypothetical protein